MQETQVRLLGQKDPMEKGMATHSSILAWRIPWTESLADYNPSVHKELGTTEATETLWSILSLCYAQVLSHVRLCVTPGTVAHQAPLSTGILQARILKWVAMLTPSGDLPNPGIKPRPPTLQVDSLPSESPGKHMNTGVGSLSILQRIFPNQESNWGLLHCMQILYPLSYQGSSFYPWASSKSRAIYTWLIFSLFFMVWVMIFIAFCFDILRPCWHRKELPLPGLTKS